MSSGDQHPPPPPPEILGSGARAEERFIDRGLIGQGGMGEVRRVTDRDLHRTMAMKILRPELLGRPQALERFLEEAQTHAQLEHPNIVPLHEVGRLEDGRTYFTMREVQGQTLKSAIVQVHRASPRERWEVSPSGWTFRRLIDAFHKICEAVAYAHSRGVVHRDLKPSNVMVGSFGEVLVMDWGLARVRPPPGAHSDAPPPEPVVTLRSSFGVQTSQEGTISGTPTYMPPEQARGALEQLGPAADVYALGAILYEILSGRPPYEGPDGQAVLAQVLAGPPPPPGRLTSSSADLQTDSSLPIGAVPEGVPLLAERSSLPGPPIPDELRQICIRAMARAPSERFPDGAALATALQAWLEDTRRQEQGVELLRLADQVLPQLQALRAEAARLKQEALVMLSMLPPLSPIEQKRPGWALEDRSHQVERDADRKELEYQQILRASFTHVPDFPEAHHRLAQFYLGMHAQAESRRDLRAAAQYEALLREHDRGQHAAYLRGEGALSLVTDPPGATVQLYRYEEQDRRLVATPLRSLGRTPLRALILPMGSYLLELTAPGYRVVRYPVCIHRQEHWSGVRPGDSEPFPIVLPRPEAQGEDEQYIPAGWFWCGGDVEAPYSFPRARLWVDGVFLRTFPVTHREYLGFLNDLVAQRREHEAALHVPRTRSDGEERSSPLIVQGRSGRYVLAAAGPVQKLLLDIPVVGVDWEGAAAFSRWEARRTGLPWRLPCELEWEKAARGVDERIFPWGNFADPTWVCTLESFSGRTHPFPVDSYPVDSSPYGVRGMAGNVRDWCLDQHSLRGPHLERGVAVLPSAEEQLERNLLRSLRGGSWLTDLKSARAAFRSGGPSSDRFGLVGFRLARSCQTC